MKAILFCTLFLVSCTSYGKKQPAANNGFAVVELFTSEGCSSCPAAEKVLAQVHGEYKQNVYVLEFHVDYWNYIGWKDVFGSKEYTLRQQQYADKFRLGSTYTPQAIVNGKSELVGSDNGKLHSIINDDLQHTPSETITLSAKANAGNIAITYTVTDPQNQLLNIALVQKNAETDVKRGENSGRKLKHMNIVRVLKTVDAQKSGTINITLPGELTKASCIIIAYAQQKDTWAVSGAAETAID